MKDIQLVEPILISTKTMKVEIITRETIKPSSPTPNHLRSFKLSLVDQVLPPIHPTLILFFDDTADSCCDSGEKVARRLKASLSETLTLFYPLAGRIKDHVSVDCKDDGVEYLEARVNCPLYDVLRQPKMETIKHLIPNECSDLLFIVQASFFECSGITLGMVLSHKIADAATFATFVTSWAANAALGYRPRDAVTPDFSAATLFPPRDSLQEMSHRLDLIRHNGISRRYVFDAPKIASLQARASSKSVPRPTRVEAVSALLWRSVIDASRSKLGSLSSSTLTWSVNLRPRLVPPLPEHSFGNLIATVVVQPADDGKADISRLIGQLREEITELKQKHAKKLEGDEASSVILGPVRKVRELMNKANGRMKFLNITSWCRFPFYDADFGWGKPTWVTTCGVLEYPEIIVLMDTRDGNGVEAWVTLIEEEMGLFESNHEVLTFGSLNPSTLN